MKKRTEVSKKDPPPTRELSEDPANTTTRSRCLPLRSRPRRATSSNKSSCNQSLLARTKRSISAKWKSGKRKPSLEEEFEMIQEGAKKLIVDDSSARAQSKKLLTSFLETALSSQGKKDSPKPETPTPTCLDHKCGSCSTCELDNPERLQGGWKNTIVSLNTVDPMNIPEELKVPVLDHKTSETAVIHTDIESSSSWNGVRSAFSNSVTNLSSDGTQQYRSATSISMVLEDEEPRSDSRNEPSLTSDGFSPISLSDNYDVFEDDELSEFVSDCLNGDATCEPLPKI